MIKKPIRDLHGDSAMPTRFCDVVIDDNRIYLEEKKGKNKYVRISWEDVVYQVEAAKNINTL